jgi:hypothetical protein
VTPTSTGSIRAVITATLPLSSPEMAVNKVRKKLGAVLIGVKSNAIELLSAARV